jgi:hypothetical protein
MLAGMAKRASKLHVKTLKSAKRKMWDHLTQSSEDSDRLSIFEVEHLIDSISYRAEYSTNIMPSYLPIRGRTWPTSNQPNASL